MPDSEDEGLEGTDSNRQGRGTRAPTDDRPSLATTDGSGNGGQRISQDTKRRNTLDVSEGKSLLVVVVICEVAVEVWMRIGVRIAEAFA